MNQPINQDFSMREAATRLRVNVSTLYRMIQRGELRTYRVGKVRRVMPEELDRIRSGQPAEADAARPLERPT